MGFGFNLLFVLIIIPLTGLLLLVWLVTQKQFWGKILGYIWAGVIAIILLSITIQFFTNKKVLTTADIYGEYIIDRTVFPNKQSDWQYNHFRFEITKNHEFIFYQTEKDKVIKTEKGKISFLDAYYSPRLIIQVDTPRHHIIEDKPTLYRRVWSFYYAFNSPKFGNVFFTKGKWKPIE